MQLQNLFQIGENILDVSRRQDGVFGELLVENVVQNLQHSYMCTLCVKQLCRQRKMLIRAGRYLHISA